MRVQSWASTACVGSAFLRGWALQRAAHGVARTYVPRATHQHAAMQHAPILLRFGGDTRADHEVGGRAQIDKCFGFDTAVEESQRALLAAKVEAASAFKGVGVVKLMGRQSGFIAMQASMASGARRVGTSWVNPLGRRTMARPVTRPMNLATSSTAGRRGGRMPHPGGVLRAARRARPAQVHRGRAPGARACGHLHRRGRRPGAAAPPAAAPCPVLMLASALFFLSQVCGDVGLPCSSGGCL